MCLCTRTGGIRMYIIAWIGLICSILKDYGLLKGTFTAEKTTDRIGAFIAFILYALITYFFYIYLKCEKF